MHCQNCHDLTVAAGGSCPHCNKAEPAIGWAPGNPPAGAVAPNHHINPATGAAEPAVGGPDPWPAAAPTPPPPTGKWYQAKWLKWAGGIVALIILTLGIIWAIRRNPDPANPTAPTATNGNNGSNGQNGANGQGTNTPGQNGANGNNGPSANTGSVDSGLPAPNQGWAQGQPIPRGWRPVGTSLAVGGSVYQLTNGVFEIPYGVLADVMYSDWNDDLPGGSFFCSPSAQTVNRWPTPPARDSLFQAPVGTPGSQQFTQVWVIYPGQCIRR